LNAKNTYTYLRRDFQLPFPPEMVSRAVGFVTATGTDPLLCAYRLYLNGALVDVGPGRGEARVWAGDGRFNGLPYTTLDLTAQLRSIPKNTNSTWAIQLMGPGMGATWAKLHMAAWKEDGSAPYVMVSDAAWQAASADAERNPQGPNGGEYSAGIKLGVEFIDARQEPVGWREPGFKAARWAAAVYLAAGEVPEGYTAADEASKMEPPMQLSRDVRPASVVQVTLGKSARSCCSGCTCRRALLVGL
jgi:hypothetical protein